MSFEALSDQGYVSPTSLMKAFVLLQVVGRRTLPFPLVFKIGMACLGTPVTLSSTHAPWSGDWT